MKRPYQIDPRPCRDFMWLQDSTTAEQVLDQLETMRRLESTSYTRRDYLYAPDSPYNSSCAAINETTRQTTIDLLYEIGDYCQFRRETVSYAIWNLLDRYLSLPHHTPLHTHSDLVLLASTCLLIAVKLLEPVSIDVQSLAGLGGFSALDLLDQERTILLALNWKIAHGPTPLQFVQLYLSLLQRDGRILADSQVWDGLLQQAQYQVELSVVRYDLVATQRPSRVGLAAVWNALETQLDGQWQTLLCEWKDDTVPKIQLALCQLQYQSETHYVRQQQQQECKEPVYGCEQEQTENYSAPALEDYHQEEPLDETETADEEESPTRYLFPSPVSVATTHYYDPKEEAKNKYYGPLSSVLRCLFSYN